MTSGLHILIAAVGSRGDIHPFLPIAQALRGRGHAVRFFVNGYHEPMVRRAGFDLDRIGSAEEQLRLVGKRDFWHPEGYLRVLFNDFAFGSMPVLFDSLARRHVPGRTVVLGSTLAVGARVAGEVFRIPMATVHASPAPLKWLGMKEGEDAVWDGHLAKIVNAFRARYGLPAVRRVMSSWWNSPQLVMGTFPGWFGLPEPYWPPHVHATGFPLYDEGDVAGAPPELKQFLDTGPPPVVITPSASMREGGDFFRAGVEACAALNRRGLLFTAHPEQVPRKLPAGVRHFPYAPFSAVLPRCAAVVHQGGIGTIAHALAAGIVQVAVPVAHDQPANSEMLERLGAARVLKPREASAGGVAAALAELLASERACARAAYLARRLASARPVERAVELVEQLAPGKKTSAPDGRPPELEACFAVPRSYDGAMPQP